MGYKITQALQDVIAEREKQISYGFDGNHDDVDEAFNKSNVGSLYALQAASSLPSNAFDILWPQNWNIAFWRPESQRSNLVKAAALILAEIEMIDREEDRIEKEDFLTKLRKANTERAKIWKYVGTDEDTFLSNELAGEVGEVAGAVKKLHRAKYGIIGNKVSEEELLANLREEIGDSMVCLDRLANHYGIDIAEVTKDKFNSKSDEVGIAVKIGD